MKPRIALLLLSNTLLSTASALAAPVDGNWKISAIHCNGIPATGDAALAVSEGNQVMVRLNGSSGEIQGTSGSCSIFEPFIVRYPDANHVEFAPTGTSRCEPSACSEECGTPNDGSPIQYAYRISGDVLTLTSPGGSEDPDDTCLSADQPGPVQYQLNRQG